MTSEKDIQHVRENSLPYLLARKLPEDFASPGSIKRGKPSLSPRKWRAFLRSIVESLPEEERTIIDRWLMSIISAQPVSVGDKQIRMPSVVADGSNDTALEILFALLAALDDELSAEIQTLKEVLRATHHSPNTQ